MTVREPPVPMVVFRFASRASVAQVAPADGLVLLAARSLGPARATAADLEHKRVLRQLQRDVRVLLDDEDGQALVLVQLPDDPEDLGDEERREAQRRLVEQQQPRAAA